MYTVKVFGKDFIKLEMMEITNVGIGKLSTKTKIIGFKNLM